MAFRHILYNSSPISFAVSCVLSAMLVATQSGSLRLRNPFVQISPVTDHSGGHVDARWRANWSPTDETTGSGGETRSCKFECEIKPMKHHVQELKAASRFARDESRH